jgi:hypothetical protein
VERTPTDPYKALHTTNIALFVSFFRSQELSWRCEAKVEYGNSVMSFERDGFTSKLLDIRVTVSIMTQVWQQLKYRFCWVPGYSGVGRLHIAKIGRGARYCCPSCRIAWRADRQLSSAVCPVRSQNESQTRRLFGSRNIFPVKRSWNSCQSGPYRVCDGIAKGLEWTAKCRRESVDSLAPTFKKTNHDSYLLCNIARNLFQHGL